LEETYSNPRKLLIMFVDPEDHELRKENRNKNYRYGLELSTLYGASARNMKTL
jgi:hypothetical protein